MKLIVSLLLGKSRRVHTPASQQKTKTSVCLHFCELQYLEVQEPHAIDLSLQCVCCVMYAGAEAPCSSAIRAAKAVIQEVPEAAGSSIRNLAKCSECNPERDVQIMSRKCGLSLGVKITQVMIQGVSVAVLLLSSWLRFMLQHNMWHIFSGLDKPDPDRASAQWSIFWENYRAVCPSHPIYARAARGEVKLSHTCALLIHGDEGRSRKKNAIFVLSAHSILGRGCNTNPAEAAVYASQKLNFTLHTWATRWLMGVLPKGFYDQDDDQDSFFQDYLQVFVQDLLEIYDKGIYSVTGEKHDFVVLNTIGDWPFLAKAFSLSRCFANVSKHPTSRKPATGICHACLADHPGYPWEDFSENPAWRQTINQESPFNGSPALMSLPHDRANPPSFIGQDCFHAWHLGAAKQFLASCLVLLVHTFAGSSIPKRFEAMSSHFLDWCKRRKVNPNIRKITRETVGWPSRADYPNAAWSKGSTSTAVLRWFLFACNDRSELQSRARSSTRLFWQRRRSTSFLQRAIASTSGFFVTRLSRSALTGTPFCDCTRSWPGKHSIPIRRCSYTCQTCIGWRTCSTAFLMMLVVPAGQEMCLSGTARLRKTSSVVQADCRVVSAHNRSSCEHLNVPYRLQTQNSSSMAS